MTSPLPKTGAKRVTKHTMPPQSLRQIFALPLLIAILGFAGLILGLTGDGWRDSVAWALVGLPILFFVRDWHRRR